MTFAVPRFQDERRLLRDFRDYLLPFLKKVGPRPIALPMEVLKTIEFGVYRWYEPPVRRDYRRLGVRELIFKLTSRCTDRCPKCGIWKKAEPDAERVGAELFEQCILDLGSDLSAVSITGGEPLLFKETVLRLGAICQEQGVAMTTVTNGFLADEAFIDAYRSQGHVLVISLDTVSPEKWSHFRGREHYDHVFRNVERAKALGARLKVQSVLALESEEDVRDVAAFCERKGIEHIVQPYMDFGGIWSGTGRGEGEEAAGPCEAWRNLCVYPNGDVVRCFDHLRIAKARDPLGNLRTERIEAILQKERTAEITEMMMGCRLPCRQLSCNRNREATWRM